MLHDPRVHEPLAGAAWDPARVEAAIRAIQQDTDAVVPRRARIVASTATLPREPASSAAPPYRRSTAGELQRRERLELLEQRRHSELTRGRARLLEQLAVLA